MPLRVLLCAVLDARLSRREDDRVWDGPKHPDVRAALEEWTAAERAQDGLPFPSGRWQRAHDDQTTRLREALSRLKPELQVALCQEVMLSGLTEQQEQLVWPTRAAAVQKLLSAGWSPAEIEDYTSMGADEVLLLINGQGRGAAAR